MLLCKHFTVLRWRVPGLYDLLIPGIIHHLVGPLIRDKSVAVSAALPCVGLMLAPAEDSRWAFAAASLSFLLSYCLLLAALFAGALENLLSRLPCDHGNVVFREVVGCLSPLSFAPFFCRLGSPESEDSLAVSLEPIKTQWRDS
jgi:uncharacterized membrane protein YhhN